MKPLVLNLHPSTVRSLKKVGLRYVLDTHEGLLRKRAGKGFYYLFKNKKVQTSRTLKRIQSLVIPPAWQSVWICQFDNGHLQATGRDARGRKQYRYHAEWSRIRNENKFGSLLQFGKVLPKIRKQVQKDLKRKVYRKKRF